MDPNKTALERAFDMAEAGEVSDIAGLRAKLKREGYSVGSIEGPSVLRQLRSLINTSKTLGANRI